jgi:probable HAF family extracellular repeat protein
MSEPATVEPSQGASESPSAPATIDVVFHFTDLGVLGGLDSAARAVSPSGVVVGHADTEPGSAQHGFHAFWWPPMAGVMFDLGTVGDDRSSAANDINGKNQIVGASLAADGRSHAFLWDGEMHDLGNLGAVAAEANAINASGQVTGTSASRAFLWIPDEPNGAVGDMFEIGTLPGDVMSIGTDLNDSGQVVGYSNDPDFMSRPFIWTPDTPHGTTGTMTELSYAPGAHGGVAQAVNADGWVIGSTSVGEPIADELPFLWVPDEPNGAVGTAVLLPTLGGDHADAFDINAAGDIVGYAQLPSEGAWPGVDHAFLYRDGTMVDLNDLLEPGSPDVELMMAEAIGDDGAIVGTAIVDGHRHAFLLTPVPAG